MSAADSRRLNDRAHRVFDRLSRYHEIAEVGGIARRYFAMNAFDGVLTSLGIIVGAYVGGVRQSGAVVSVVAAAAASMGVSGAYGSYLIERAERGRALRELEESTLSHLHDTDIGAASRYASVVIGIIDGLSPAIASAIILVPFFVAGSSHLHAAFYAGGAIAFVELFGLGMFLGRVSRQGLIVAGLKLVIAGVVSLGLSLLLNIGKL
jgi:predicted membrane protein (TIGR00267 family)